MKKQKKLSLKVRDLKPLKDVKAGRRRVQGGGGGPTPVHSPFL
jgi:hypothetical protein